MNSVARVASSSTVRRVRRALACLGALAPAFAVAGAGTMWTTVEPISETVTYSTNATTSPAVPALVTYVGYRVTVLNDGGNTINNIRFTGSTSVTDPDERAVFSSAEGANCVTTNTDRTAIECTIGQLRAGQAFPEFVVFFRAPVKVVNGVADDPDQDRVAFSGITYYAEGTGGVPQSVPQNSTEFWAAGPVTLGTFNPEVVKSAVPRAGGTFFTGAGAVPFGSDLFATSVVVPPAPTYTRATIVEAPEGIVNCNNFSQCFSSTLTIPGTFSPFLGITLRQDASTLKPGFKLAQLIIEYTSDSGITTLLSIASNTCQRTNGLPVPTGDGVPCIDECKVFKNGPDRSDPEWTAALAGDLQCRLVNTNNGRFIIR